MSHDTTNTCTSGVGSSSTTRLAEIGATNTSFVTLRTDGVGCKLQHWEMLSSLFSLLHLVAIETRRDQANQIHMVLDTSVDTCKCCDALLK